jgi:hypothetical protein
MADLLVLEFDGVDETDYAKVNAQLDLDPKDRGRGVGGRAYHPPGRR